MNYAPAPSLLSTIVSFFHRRTPQPTFTPALPYHPTQVFVTRETTTDIPPSYPSFSAPCAEKSKPALLQCTAIVEQKLPHVAYPDTPRAPDSQRTTFVLPLRLKTEPRYRDDDQASISTASDVDIDLDIPPGRAIVAHPTEPGVYTVAEPKTLARALFLYGFWFPAFWLVGLAIIFTPLRPTPDWEVGKTSAEVEWTCKIIRETELRWAKRCLFALLSEILFVMVVLVIARWGTVSPVS
ncbi:hypothetical protein BU17DRAFT_39182 [Hysterangium stoloniferum]|nr:hypothetical protein BU17DRAFT_39182 [Hysterangium stoloniferum]